MDKILHYGKLNFWVCGRVKYLFRKDRFNLHDSDDYSVDLELTEEQSLIILKYLKTFSKKSPLTMEIVYKLGFR